MEGPKEILQKKKASNGDREEIIKRLQIIRNNVSLFVCFVAVLKEKLQSLCNAFIGGQTAKYWHEWTKLTSDAQILADIQGITIECTEIPVQHKLRGSSPDDPNFKDIDAAVHKLHRKEIVNVTDYVSGQIVSDIFPHPKKDGTYRLILNLREFNEIVEYHHFKMDSLVSVLRLMEPNCFMASIDIKDAYYSFAIKPGDRKLLCLLGKGYYTTSHVCQMACLQHLGRSLLNLAKCH